LFVEADHESGGKINTKANATAMLLGTQPLGDVYMLLSAIRTMK